MIETIAMCVPLVLGFHGHGGVSTEFMADYQGEMVRLQAPEPDRSWALTSNRDIPMVRRVIRQESKKRCVSKVVAVGHSKGAHFVSNLACNTRLVDEVVALAGATVGPPPRCRSKKPVRWLIVHSKDDWLVPYDGTIIIPDILPSWSGVHRREVARTWAQRNGCKRVLRAKKPSGERIWRWRGCDDRATVTLRVGTDWQHGPPPWWNAGVERFVKRAAAK